jgi:hypothetical protein
MGVMVVMLLMFSAAIKRTAQRLEDGLVVKFPQLASNFKL